MKDDIDWDKDQEIIPEDPGLIFWAKVQHKKTGQIGVMRLYHEDIVDERLRLLEKLIGGDPNYRQLLDQLHEFHRRRREEEQKLQEEITVLGIWS